MFCNKCGNKMDGSAIFCGKCGNKIIPEKSAKQINVLSTGSMAIQRIIILIASAVGILSTFLPWTSKDPIWGTMIGASLALKSAASWKGVVLGWTSFMLFIVSLATSVTGDRSRPLSLLYSAINAICGLACVWFGFWFVRGAFALDSGKISGLYGMYQGEVFRFIGSGIYLIIIVGACIFAASLFSLARRNATAQRIMILVASIVGMLSTFLPWTSDHRLLDTKSGAALALSSGANWFGVALVLFQFTLFTVPMITSIIGGLYNPLTLVRRVISAICGVACTVFGVFFMSILSIESGQVISREGKFVSMMLMNTGSGIYLILLAGICILITSLFSFKRASTTVVPGIGNELQSAYQPEAETKKKTAASMKRIAAAVRIKNVIIALLLAVVAAGGFFAWQYIMYFGVKAIGIAAGRGSSFAIQADGSLLAWGQNRIGQLGDGTRKDRSALVKVMDSVASVSANGEYTMAVKTDGSLWAWGGSQFGGKKNSLSPVKIMDSVVSVSVGNYHAMAIKTDGSLWALGVSNHSGQFGDGTIGTGRRDKPVKIMDSAASVSAGHDHTMAIKTDGSLWAWGSNRFGQLGDGTGSWQSKPTLKPIKIMDSVASVSAGYESTMAIKTDGSLWAWGGSQFGGKKNSLSPVKIMDSVVSVSVGNYHAMAIKNDDSLWALGNNECGQLGDGTKENRPTPVKIMDSVASVAAGSLHTIAIKTDGSLWVWGNDSGKISEGGSFGDGRPKEGRSSPTLVKVKDSIASQPAPLVATSEFTSALMSEPTPEQGDVTAQDSPTPEKTTDSVESQSTPQPAQPQPTTQRQSTPTPASASKSEPTPKQTETSLPAPPVSSQTSALPLLSPPPSQTTLGREIKAYRLIGVQEFTGNNPGEMMGKAYQYGFYTIPNNQNQVRASIGSVFYNIGNKYTRMSGLYGPMDNIDSDGAAQLTIYGDDRKLETFNILASDETKTFNLNVAGVTQIKFEYVISLISKGYSHHFGVANVTLYASKTPSAASVSEPTSVSNSTSVIPSQPVSDPSQPVSGNLAVGTPIKIITSSTISTATAHTGDRFEAALNEDITDDGRVIARRGSIVKGMVTDSDPEGRRTAKGVATITLQLTGLTLADGRVISIQTTYHIATATSSDTDRTGIGTAINKLTGRAADTAPETRDPAVVKPGTQIKFDLAAPLNM